MAVNLPAVGFGKSEPAIKTGAQVGAGLVAMLAVLKSFGVPITPDQDDALQNFAVFFFVFVLPILQGWLTRFQVFSFASVQAIKAEADDKIVEALYTPVPDAEYAKFVAAGGVAAKARPLISSKTV